jgi:hypothetical protein
MFSGKVNILVFQTVLDRSFHSDTDALLVGLETFMTDHTRSISVSSNTLVRVGDALVFRVQVIIRFAFGADFLTA